MILDEVADRFPFWATAVLLVLGLYGMMGKRSLVKKIIGLNIFQSAIILFFISQSMKAGATIPILVQQAGPVDPDQYVNPLPHVMMLTAIVVSAAVTGVALAFLVAIHRQFHSMDEKEILAEVRQ
jgi:multicomponent Na+:H+ antiporter subunit C